MWLLTQHNTFNVHPFHSMCHTSFLFFMAEKYPVFGHTTFCLLISWWRGTLTPSPGRIQAKAECPLPPYMGPTPPASDLYFSCKERNPPGWVHLAVVVFRVLLPNAHPARPISQYVCLEPFELDPGWKEEMGPESCWDKRQSVCGSWRASLGWEQAAGPPPHSLQVSASLLPAPGKKLQTSKTNKGLFQGWL